LVAVLVWVTELELVLVLLPEFVADAELLCDVLP
jgi:hypothetical protein